MDTSLHRSRGVIEWLDDWWMFLLILFGIAFVSVIVFFPTQTEDTNIHRSPVGAVGTPGTPSSHQ